MNPFIYLRALKHAEHTVFCVEDGQKTYYDPQFSRRVPYSSGQQVKRSILQSVTDILNVPVAPITFNYNITKNNELENKEPWSPCNPVYVDQLLGGWMRAKTATGKAKNDGDKDNSKENNVVKRRSPLSISAMRPIHPLLAGVESENLTFDRSDRPDYHSVNVRMAGSDKLLTEDEIEAFLSENGRTLSRRVWIPENKRATGLFVYDVAIDLRTLFCVSTNQHEPEISKDMINELKSKGWIESENVFGKCLVLPEAERNKIIPALASALIDWWLLVVAVTNSPKHDFNRCKSATCRFLFRDTKSARDKNGTKPRKNKVKDTSPEISLVEYLCFVCKGTNLSLEKRGEIPISLIHNSFSYHCTPNVVIANGFDLKQHDLRKSGVKFCFAL